MTTLSVPLPEETVRAINQLVEQGLASNKAELLRRAIQAYIEQQLVEEVLRASKEPSLKGDLDELARKL